MTRFGLIVPSTNTSVEVEYHDFRPPGVSWHTSRIMIRAGELSSDEDFEAFLVHLRNELDLAIDSVLTCNPTHLVMGMSAETFWGGVKGNAEFEQAVRDRSGLSVITGAGATKAALEAFGAKKIGVITPYQPVGDTQVEAFYTELGYEVNAVCGLKSPSATAIADETPRAIRDAFRSVDADDVDVLIQAGTNLLAIDVAAELERELNKPVIAINLATIWHALRSSGHADRFPGRGRLVEEF